MQAQAVNENAKASPRYLSAAETAKEIRAALKQHFPKQKFSVRTSVYSMGASIDVRWVGGPDHGAVNSVCAFFAGSEFDGMTDSKTSKKAVMLRGEWVKFCADFVFCKRED